MGSFRVDNFVALVGFMLLALAQTASAAPADVFPAPTVNNSCYPLDPYASYGNWSHVLTSKINANQNTCKDIVDFNFTRQGVNSRTCIDVARDDESQSHQGFITVVSYVDGPVDSFSMDGDMSYCDTVTAKNFACEAGGNFTLIAEDAGVNYTWHLSTAFSDICCGCN